MKKDNIGFIFLTVFLLIASIFAISLYVRQMGGKDSFDIKTFPYRVGEWSGKDLEVTEREYEILETRNILLREYKNAAGNIVYLFIIYSDNNRSVFHPPEVCFVGDGVSITDKMAEPVDVGSSEVSVNKLLLEKGQAKEVALYGYKVGDIYTDNFYVQQSTFAIKQLLGLPGKGATVRVSANIVKNADHTTSILKSFLKETIRELNKIN